MTAEQLADREVIIVLDTTAWIQLGKMADVTRQSKAIKTVLDHHVSGDDLGANCSRIRMPRLLAGWLSAADALGVPLTPEIAEPSFAALATDTGWFRFASTTADTLRWPGAWSMRANPTCFTSIFTNTTAWPVCSLSDARWPGPARSWAAD